MTEEKFQQHIDALSSEIENAKGQIHTMSDLEAFRVKYAGRKGVISSLFKELGKMSPEIRSAAGKKINDLKDAVQSFIDNHPLSAGKQQAGHKRFDMTLPGEPVRLGSVHPITVVTRQIKSVFEKMGFSVVSGPEVESEYYNFEALNIPQGHPARDMQDTLFIDKDIVLRTHTSPVQIRTMELTKPPVRIISPGKCYRRDTPDASHSPVFHQVEGLVVDEGITFADLKGVILNFARQMFGSNMKIRFRPSYFPFVEPGAEYDFTCLICGGKGCRVCKQTGWVEISGAGMVNPAVYNYVGYDAEKYTGFAFGMGIERIAMLLYEVHDIRLFYENDIRFLKQF